MHVPTRQWKNLTVKYIEVFLLFICFSSNIFYWNCSCINCLVYSIFLIPPFLCVIIYLFFLIFCLKVFEILYLLIIFGYLIILNLWPRLDYSLNLLLFFVYFDFFAQSPNVYIYHIKTKDLFSTRCVIILQVTQENIRSIRIFEHKICRQMYTLSSKKKI